MTPYYEDDSVTIYHGDCREIMPDVWYDCILADPPYGIAYDASHEKYKGGIPRFAVTGDDEPFDGSHLVHCPAILWGGNCFADTLPRSPKWLAWVKTARDDANIRQADMELAWTNCVSRPRVFHHLWIGAFKASESGIRAVHPTQKPVALMSWCLGFLPDGVVLDPYMGSGPTLRAAKDLGRRAIGIEIEERYCEIAAQRMMQEVLAL